MSISQEEVRFGVVPGLAKLINSLGGAFARSRERQHQVELADIKAGTQSRAQAATKLGGDLKRAEVLGGQGRQRIVPTGEMGDLPKTKITDEDEVVVQEEQLLKQMLQMPGLGAFLNNSLDNDAQMIEVEKGLDAGEDVGGLLNAIPDEQPLDARITAILGKEKAGLPLSPDEQTTANQMRSFSGSLNDLDEYAKRGAKLGDVGQPIVGGAEFLKSKLQSGEFNPSTLNIDFNGGQSLMDLMEYAQLIAGNEGDVAEAQALLADLMSIQNPDAHTQGRIADLQKVTPPPEYDTMPEIEAAFAQQQQAAVQWNMDQELISQDPSMAISQLAEVELNGSEKREIDSVLRQIDMSIAESAPENIQAQVAQSAQLRRDIAQNIKDGGNLTTALFASMGANVGRGHRMQSIGSVWPADRKFSQDFIHKNADTIRARAIKNGKTPAQAEFMGQAGTVVQNVPLAIIDQMAGLDKASVITMLSKMRNGLRGAGQGDKISIDEAEEEALLQLYSSNGLGRNGASLESDAIVSGIFAAYPNMRQFPQEQPTAPMMGSVGIAGAEFGGLGAFGN